MYGWNEIVLFFQRIMIINLINYSGVKIINIRYEYLMNTISNIK